MDTDRFVTYGVLSDRESALKAELKSISEQRRQLGEELLDDLLDAGFPKITVTIGQNDSGQPVNKTIYIQRQLWAGHSHGKEALTDALKESGYEELVKDAVNTSTLSAMIREYDPQNNRPVEDIMAELPAPLQEAIKITEKVELRSRNC